MHQRIRFRTLESPSVEKSGTGQYLRHFVGSSDSIFQENDPLSFLPIKAFSSLQLFQSSDSFRPRSGDAAQRGVAQLGRALVLGTRCRRFESCLPDHYEPSKVNPLGGFPLSRSRLPSPPYRSTCWLIVRDLAEQSSVPMDLIRDIGLTALTQRVLLLVDANDRFTWQ